MKRIQNRYKVLANSKACAKFFVLRLDAPLLAKQIAAGQFIHIRVSDELAPFFRRPFSVYRAKGAVEILYEVVGKGTEILSQKRRGETLDVLGPLGNGFTLPDAKISQVVLIGGGVGVAPLMVLSDSLKKRKNLKQILLYGGRSKNYVPGFKNFALNGAAVHVATNDGSAGKKGFVTSLFDEVVWDPEATLIYTCGPVAMMAAVQEFAKRKQIRGQAAAEEVMACGLGACLGCSIMTTKGYKTVCHDGPVFGLDEIIFKT